MLSSLDNSSGMSALIMARQPLCKPGKCFDIEQMWRAWSRALNSHEEKHTHAWSSDRRTDNVFMSFHKFEYYSQEEWWK